MTAVMAAPLGALAVEIVDRVVAIVNDDVISLYELNQSVQPFVQQIQSSQYPKDVEQQMLFEMRQKVLQQLIDQKLTDQELTKLQITVSEEEVDRSIERIKESNFLTDEKLRSDLDKQGIPYEDFRENIRKQLLRVKLVSREIRSKIVITEEDIKAYYEKHSDQYAGKKKYLLRNLYSRLPSFASDQEKQIALGIMETIHRELEAGKSFDKIAQEYAAATALIEHSELGFFQLDELSELLREIIRPMKSGDFTAVLEANFGYQIVYVETIDEVGGKTLEDATPEIQQKLYDEIVDEKYDTWLQVLRERSHIKIIN